VIETTHISSNRSAHIAKDFFPSGRNQASFAVESKKT